MVTLHRRPGRPCCRFAQFWRQGAPLSMTIALSVSSLLREIRLEKLAPPCFPSLVRTLHSWRSLVSTQNLSFSFTAMAVMTYALYTYHWRAASIRRGGRGPYDDRVGPVSLENSIAKCWAIHHEFYPDCTLHCTSS